MKVAVITGTSSGMGESFARTLLELGWKVYGISRRDNPELLTHDNFRQILMDLEKPIEKGILDKIIGEKKIELLVNNAGICIMQPADVWDEKVYQDIFRIHYATPIELVAFFTAKLAEGMIVNVLSDSATLGWPDFGIYGASKAALLLHSKSFAYEHPEINVINLHPSSVDTPMTEVVGPAAVKERHNFMSTAHISSIFSQIVSGIMPFKSGSSIFLHNNWQLEDMKEINKDMYLYNVDTEKLLKI